MTIAQKICVGVFFLGAAAILLPGLHVLFYAIPAVLSASDAPLIVRLIPTGFLMMALAGVFALIAEWWETRA